MYGCTTCEGGWEAGYMNAHARCVASAIDAITTHARFLPRQLTTTHYHPPPTTHHHPTFSALRVDMSRRRGSSRHSLRNGIKRRARIRLEAPSSGLVTPLRSEAPPLLVLLPSEVTASTTPCNATCCGWEVGPKVMCCGGGREILAHVEPDERPVEAIDTADLEVLYIPLMV